VESILGHLAWLADVERDWPSRRLPLGWAFRVYNATTMLRLRWYHFPAPRGMLAPAALTKLDKAIAKLLAVSSDSIDELRTPKGLAKASKLTMPGADRTCTADSLEKLLRLMGKHVFGGPVASRRAPEFEKRLHRHRAEGCRPLSPQSRARDAARHGGPPGECRPSWPGAQA
jgi:hypothetical protein